MSLLDLQQTLREKVLETAQSVFNIKLEQVACEVPPKTELGDLAFPVSFELAKRIKQETGEKQNPRFIAEQLKLSKASAKANETEAQVDAALSRLWRLGQDMAKAEPARRREVFRQLVSRIDLRFDKVQRGKRTECPLNSGEIHLRTTEDSIFGSVSRGDSI